MARVAAQIGLSSDESRSDVSTGSTRARTRALLGHTWSSAYWDDLADPLLETDKQQELEKSPEPERQPKPEPEPILAAQVKSSFLDQLQNSGDFVQSVLREAQPLQRVFDKIEDVTKVKREFVAVAVLTWFTVYMVLGAAAELICNVVSYAYPAVKTYEALATGNKDDNTQWLTYWCVFAFASLIDFFSGEIMSYLPFYWLIKFTLLLYLYAPQTKGAEKVYKNGIVPGMEWLYAHVKKE